MAFKYCTIELILIQPEAEDFLGPFKFGTIFQIRYLASSLIEIILLYWVKVDQNGI